MKAIYLQTMFVCVDDKCTRPNPHTCLKCIAERTTDEMKSLDADVFFSDNVESVDIQAVVEEFEPVLKTDCGIGFNLFEIPLGLEPV